MLSAGSTKIMQGISFGKALPTIDTSAKANETEVEFGIKCVAKFDTIALVPSWAIRSGLNDQTPSSLSMPLAKSLHH